LISESINTLKHSLIEEAIIVSLVIIVFLFHFRSALIPILTLPIALAISFIPMYYLNVSSNIMSLGGLALAIGVLVDAAIVMVEKGYRHLSGARPTSFAQQVPSRPTPGCIRPPWFSLGLSSIDWPSCRRQTLRCMGCHRSTACASFASQTSG
jgi:hypothetical protein